MQANELRIGNYIQNNGGGQETVFGIKEKSVIVLFADADINIFEPIPLTEEWLVRLGFTKDKLDDNWYFPTNRIYPIYQRGKRFGFNGAGMSVREFEFVHELQNLVYAMSKHELCVK